MRGSFSCLLLATAGQNFQPAAGTLDYEDGNNGDRTFDVAKAASACVTITPPSITVQFESASGGIAAPAPVTLSIVEPLCACATANSGSGGGGRGARIRVPSLLCAIGMWLAACGGGGGSPPAAPATSVQPPAVSGTPDAPPAGPVVPAPAVPSPASSAGISNILSGQVYSFATGAIADAAITLGAPGVDFDGTPIEWRTLSAPLSNGAGQFTAGGLPSGRVGVFAMRSGFVQPCAASAILPTTEEVRLELVPESSLDSFQPVPPQTSREPTLRGAVYEPTPSGRQSVAGATLWVEEVSNYGIAMTLSDRGGGYLLCNLPKQVAIGITKPGYGLRWIGPIETTDANLLEVPLARMTSSRHGAWSLGNFDADSVVLKRDISADVATSCGIGEGSSPGAARTEVSWRITIRGTQASLEEDMGNWPSDHIPYEARLTGNLFYAHYTTGPDYAQSACPFREAFLSGIFYADASYFVATELLIWGTPGKEVRVQRKWIGKRVR